MQEELLRDRLKIREVHLTNELLRYHNRANFNYVSEIHKQMDRLFAERAAVRHILADVERKLREKPRYGNSLARRAA